MLKFKMKSNKYTLEVHENEEHELSENGKISWNDTDSGYCNNNTVEIPLNDEEDSPPPPEATSTDSPKRQVWDNQVEFLMSCIAMSVGLGNIWRFPFIAFENGGGAFVIPYLIVLFLVGKPMYFLEMAMGQFCSKGSCKIWQMVPFFKGVGYGATFGTACVMSFYCALMAITVFYFVQSFSSVLPWDRCNPDWELSHNITCENNTVIGTNMSIPELYFKVDVFHEKDQIDDGIGAPDWRLALCLLASWIIIFITLIRGVQSSGKVAYFTALFPYFVLLVFLIRGVTLPGALDGIWYFLNPKWSKLLEGKVWVAAVTQCFFSMSIAFGPVITYSSYNPFTHNIYKDAMIVSVMDTFTSLLAGITTFSVLGNLAAQSNKSVPEVAKGGPGLAFISYPATIATFPVPQLFSVLFFLMLFTLGIGSATSLAGGLITVIHDKFTTLNKLMITVFVSIFGFCTGLIYITPGGLWMLELVNFYGAGSIVYMIAILELTGMVYVYGISNLVRDIEFMLNRRISLYWVFCWVLTPVVLATVLVYSLITDEGLKHDGHYYPTIAYVCGWLLVTFAILMLPGFALHGIFQQDSKEGVWNKLKQSFKPLQSPEWGEWGPMNLSDRLRWQNYKKRSLFSFS